ncbi:MAG: hypothetical protein E7179_02250 [Erysipelotrichaceae bacterium]|jgi:hypothetical protein|nr:hypothetical protein [Erysipelotrichaceae bacterium]
MRKFPFVLAIISAIVSATLVGLYLASDDSLNITHYEYASKKVTASLNGYKIVQLSDLHNHPLEYKNNKLLDAVDSVNPDVILVSGDMVDSHSEEIHFQNLNTIYSHFKAKGYPVYAVSGNHEAYCPKEFMERYRSIMATNGVKYPEMTENAYAKLADGLYVSCIGDPGWTEHDPIGFLWRVVGNVDRQMDVIDPKMDKSAINIALTHRPELFDYYAKHGYDLCYTGHTHGNQLGIYVPFALNQLPARYIYGRYEDKASTMILSAGLGYSWSMPFRVGRNAEITVTTLKSA